MSILIADRKSLSPTDHVLVEKCESATPHELNSKTFSGFAHQDVLRRYLIWFPEGMPTGSSVVVASSRLNQKLDEHSDWFNALRTLAVQISTESKFLITATGTTTDRFVRRIAALFQIDCFNFKPFPAQPSERWFEEQTRDKIKLTQQGDTKFGKHPKTAFFKLLQFDRDGEGVPTVDEALISIAKTTVLLSVRSGGNIHKSTQHRLCDQPQSSTRLLINRGLTKRKTEQELLESGATAWWVYEPPALADKNTDQRRLSHPQSPILSVDEIQTENYLSHWTRRRAGPWPDQSTPEYLDDLIFQSSRRKHSELSALCRILASRKVLATNHLTRDERPVVCLSDLSLNLLPSQRVFRPHLSRWDFEPFGIAIGREVLEKLHARPVLYGTEADWQQLPDDQKPFFQLKKSKSEKIDWRLECEWRLIGDLGLDQIRHDQALVFVPSYEDAEVVSCLSNWPIVVLNENSPTMG